MTCQIHPDVPAVAYCRTCGKPVCEACRHEAYGTVFCAEHLPAPAAPREAPGPGFAAPGPAASAATGAVPGVAPMPYYAHAEVSPGLALFLGFIPGVGAIYNGQYAKGLVHAVIFGVIVSILNSNVGNLDALFGILLSAWIFYMAFEAYHTARKRRAGEPVDEYSSLLTFKGRQNNAPVAGIVLVVLGVLLLLHTLNLFDFTYLTRYWPVLLIGAGVYLLYSRFAGSSQRS